MDSLRKEGLKERGLLGHLGKLLRGVEAVPKHIAEREIKTVVGRQITADIVRHEAERKNSLFASERHGEPKKELQNAA